MRLSTSSTPPRTPQFPPHLTHTHTHSLHGTATTAAWSRLVKAFWAENSEIALHTVDHLPLSDPFPGPGNLTHEMLGVRTWLNETCGIPLEDMVGFRCPYLAHDPPVREVLLQAGLTYDSSILEYWPSSTSPSSADRLWPYTMDSGIPQVGAGRHHHPSLATPGMPAPLPSPSLCTCEAGMHARVHTPPSVPSRLPNQPLANSQPAAAPRRTAPFSATTARKRSATPACGSSPF